MKKILVSFLLIIECFSFIDCAKERNSTIKSISINPKIKVEKLFNSYKIYEKSYCEILGVIIKFNKNHNGNTIITIGSDNNNTEIIECTFDNKKHLNLKEFEKKGTKVKVIGKVISLQIITENSKEIKKNITVKDCISIELWEETN